MVHVHGHVHVVLHYTDKLKYLELVTMAKQVARYLEYHGLIRFYSHEHFRYLLECGSHMAADKAVTLTVIMRVELGGEMCLIVVAQYPNRCSYIINIHQNNYSQKFEASN